MYTRYLTCDDCFILINSALGQNCMEQSSDMDECTASDDNSECDIGNTDKCICSAGYFEEFAVCKGE